MEWRRRDAESTSLAKNYEQSETFLACATEIRAVPGPTGTMTINQQARRLKETDDIEKQLVFKDIETFDDIFVIYDPKQHDLHWNSPQCFVVDPRLFGYFLLDHKLYCDF